MSGSVLLCDVDVDGALVDVLLTRGKVAAVGRALAAPPDAERIDGRGGTLLPGLHDHHLHLLAMAAARQSVDVSTLDRAGFTTALRDVDAALAPGDWMRVIGYHESSVGPLDRASLDATVATRPVRVQHATGAMWVLNSVAIDAIGLDRAAHAGIERDERGRPTGRLFGADDWLRHRLPRAAPDLSVVGRELSQYGICGVTDATPYRDRDDLAHLRDAAASGAIPQRVVITGAPDLLAGDVAPLIAGPAKVIVDDRDPPSIEVLAEQFSAAHAQRGNVALHCASRLAIVLAVAAFERAGAAPGDRIEHGAVIPPELFGRLRGLGVTVVTQPAFVYSRGDRYLSDVAPEDLPHLWRCNSLRAEGIPVGFGSDAPHGPADPWVAVRAASERRTRAGRSLGPADRLRPEQAAARFLAPWHDPGGPARRITVGAPADCCLLHAPISEVLRAPSAGAVRGTFVDGVQWYRSDARP
jgi:predicted amidohydrolase YtcJ